MRILIALIVALAAANAFAFVDMKNANFSDSWTDIQIEGTGYDLKITRTYNSRSLYNGFFGFGWCSNIETAMEFANDGSFKIKECGDGLETSFKSKSSGKDGQLFTAVGHEVETVLKKPDHYLRNLADGSSQRYDLSGHLTQMFDKNGNFIKIAWKGNTISDVTDNNARKLSFNFYPNTNKVKEIVGPNKLTCEYKYKDVNNLASAKLATGNLFSYEYDDLHNLKLIKYPDGSSKALTYDVNRDWVTSLRDRDGCTENYEYIPSQDDPKNHYTSNVVKKCGDKVTNKSKFEFWYKEAKAQGGKFLYKVAMDVNGDKTEIVYHEKFNKPVSIKKNGKLTSFVYYDNGLVKSRDANKEVTTFKYEPKYNKVSQVAIGKKVTDFSYDARGNLTTAKNTTGQIVKLKYDNQGRISYIEDQARRQVKIEYEERFGKPKYIERIGLGAIQVSYKPTGEIDKLNSKDGQSIALQVASTFNNLLEVVAPAGIDLGL